MLELIQKGTEFVSDEIWYRVVQMVTNEEALQEYAARKVTKRANPPHRILYKSTLSRSSIFWGVQCMHPCRYWHRRTRNMKSSLCQPHRDDLCRPLQGCTRLPGDPLATSLRVHAKSNPTSRLNEHGRWWRVRMLSGG
eukprot:550192-Prorocentrum_minimum.AAC.1